MFLRIIAPMLRSTIDFDTVRKIGLALPGVEESGWRNGSNPAVATSAKAMSCTRCGGYTHKPTTG